MVQSLLLPFIARRLLPLFAALAVIGVLYAASSQFTGDYGLLDINEHTVRGVAHFLVYGTLALMVAAALCRWHLAAWLICIRIATREEIHQLFIPGRFCSMGDWVINVCGITFFLLVAWQVGSRRRRERTASDGMPFPSLAIHSRRRSKPASATRPSPPRTASPRADPR